VNVRVRIAGPCDAERVAPLLDAYRQFYAQPADPGLALHFLRERFAHHESCVLLAEDDEGAAAGFVQMFPLFSTVRAVRTYLLNDLFVAPVVRGHGVGRQLLAAAAQFARANGAASMSLQTANDNAPARALYESSGWMREQCFGEYTLALS